MKRRLLISLACTPLLASAAPPAVQLLVEWRWVDSRLPPAAQAGVRDGAVVVGTAGSVSPRGPGVVTSTAAPPAAPVQRLLVLNGQTAALRLTQVEPLHGVDASVELLPGRAGPRVHASPRQGESRREQTLELTLQWPGGRAPVRVAFSIDDGEGTQAQSTVQLPLGHWQVVARSAAAALPAPPGTLRSGDAAGQPVRELQLRLSIQP